jgi:hypothetical protein
MNVHRVKRVRGASYVQIFLILIVLIKPGFCFGDDNLDAVIAKVVKARDYTTQFVVLAKKSFKEGTPEYNQAFKLYAAAYSDYDSWNAYLTSALAAGRVKGRTALPHDSKYDDLSAAATNSATKFVSYVDSNTPGQEKAVVTILSSLADLGLKLWTGISKKITDDRNALSKRFADATQWQSWEQISDGSAPIPKPAPTSTPKSNKSRPPAADKAPQ